MRADIENFKSMFRQAKDDELKFYQNLNLSNEAKKDIFKLDGKRRGST